MEILRAVDLSGLLTKEVSSILILGLTGGFFLWIALRAGSTARLWRTLIDIFGNWRLVLLGLTGVVLSLASGYTTWDGMRNFTNEPVLSLMITFGIQGVMLITAWLIGETFAKQASGAHNVTEELAEFFRAIVFALVVGGLLVGLVYGVTLLTAPENLKMLNAYVAQGSLWIGGGLAALLLLAFVLLFFQGAEIIGPYARGLRIILANLHLWVMFLACMATSVFFSFDSLFTQIFPQDERKRAADIRSINQVSGTIADIGVLARTRRMEAADALFRSKAWTDYEGQLETLAGIARRAPEAIERHFTQKLQDKQQAIARHQQTMANAKSTQAGLNTRQSRITEELSSLKSRRPAALAEEQAQRSVVLEAEKRLDGKKTEALAEEKGVEGSLKIGKGQNYRARKAEEAQIAAELEVARERYKGKKSAIDLIDKSIKTLEAELALVNGELEKLKGMASTAEQLIRVVEDQGKNENAPKFDPTGGLSQLERERVSFRQKPEQEGLQRLATLCGTLNSAIIEVPNLKEQAQGLECDPGPAAEAAARLFALNVGLNRYEANCATGDKLPQTGGTDALLQFAGRCVQDSGLAGKDTALLRDKLNAIALNRDDKAHRFVVTWNAFNDGNRLAYLALAIAFAIDGLVFMSGIFGANAVSSPLANAPAAKSRSIASMHDIVDNALLPERLANVELALNAMHPIYLERMRDFTSHIDVRLLADKGQRARVMKVLTAGSSLGLVRSDETNPGSYLVRTDFYEYLASVRKRLFDRLEEEDKRGHVEMMPALIEDGSAAKRASERHEHHEMAEDEPRAKKPAMLGRRQAALPKPQTSQASDNSLLRRLSAAREARSEGMKPLATPRSSATVHPLYTESQVRERFTNALDITEHDRHLIRESGLDDEIAAAVRLVTELCKRDETLLARFDEFAEERRKAIERQSTQLDKFGGSGADFYELVNREANEAKDLVTPAMLLKGNGYDQVLRQLVLDYQAAAGDLNQIEERKLEALRVHYNEVHDNDRRSRENWRRFCQSVEGAIAELGETRAVEGQSARNMTH
ncbi:MAG: hypothetical protein F9K44_06915 [Hyphomicrobiaceae bacterium]|nr:MAG: hypothetical protein F9K44_06915 [Hyphomicrobiaceae bacterium]